LTRGSVAGTSIWSARQLTIERANWTKIESLKVDAWLSILVFLSYTWQSSGFRLQAEKTQVSYPNPDGWFDLEPPNIPSEVISVEPRNYPEKLLAKIIRIKAREIDV
jgi:hypothetical protein